MDLTATMGRDDGLDGGSVVALLLSALVALCVVAGAAVVGAVRRLTRGRS